MPPGIALHHIGLHHIGIVVPDIDSARPLYASLGYTERTAVIHDPAQTAFVQFLKLPEADHYLELVAPDGPESFLDAAASKKHPLHHLCYTTADIHASCASLEAGGWRLISEPTPAVAFDGRPVAWLLAPTKLVVEFVQKGDPNSL
jgi:methylmalonyl-CoA/ethylmalonyl-CoA epimerase